MRRDNRGFTLIELLIAIAVLSIMSGVLLRALVMSQCINAKARVHEVVLDAAERTMETIKGSSLTDLDERLRSSNLSESDPYAIELNGITYQCVKKMDSDQTQPADSGEPGYILTSEAQHLGGTGGNGNYILEAEICWSRYGDPDAASEVSDSDTTESEAQSVPDRSRINTSRIPRIADVSIPRNMVLDHQTLLSKEEAWWVDFDIINQQLVTRLEDGTENYDNCYDSSEVHRFLHLTYSETSGSSKTTLTMNPRLEYILPASTGGSIWRSTQVLSSDVRKKTYSLGTISRRFDLSAGDPSQVLPRIYLFLPHYTDGAQPVLDGVIIDYKGRLKNSYEFYLIPEGTADTILINGSAAATNQVLNMSAQKNSSGDDGGLKVYTFSKQDGQLEISEDAAKKRIYEIYVRVYEENDYPENHVLELHSTKRE